MARRMITRATLDHMGTALLKISAARRRSRALWFAGMQQQESLETTIDASR